MKKWKHQRGKRYSIIISSSDVRKKTTVISVSLRTLLFSLVTTIIVVFTLAGVAAASFINTSEMCARVDLLMLLAAAEPNSAAIEAPRVEAQNNFNEAESADSGGQSVLSGNATGTFSIDIEDVESDTAEPVYEETEQIFIGTAEASESILSAGQEAEGSLNITREIESVKAITGVTENEKSDGGEVRTAEFEKLEELIPMEEAMAVISADFAADLDTEIAVLKEKEDYKNAQVVFDGDTEGDSQIVNNWADVISVFSAVTMYDDQRLLDLSADRIKLLKKIYYDMNEISIQCSTNRLFDTDEGVAAGEDAMYISVSVDSLTYLEGAEMYYLDKKQENKLEQLMSPAYYIYFDDLLGLDVYDGMGSEQIAEIISALPEGEIGSQVVKAALIRLGSPYSKARRGSGNYVDCSYFTWWAYNQAGISIPTSSVEQAKFCYYNGKEIEYADLRPGDLVFWSKRSCDCGRWHEIHHVGIYIGSNKVIEASSSKGRVVIRELWGLKGGTEWKIYMFGRPYR